MLFRAKAYYPKRRKRLNLIQPRTLGVFFLCLAVGSMYFYVYREGPPSSFLSSLVLSPLSKVQHLRTSILTSVNHFSYFFSNKETLEQLRNEIDRLRQENVEFRYKIRQLESYREALRFPHDEEFPGITGIVVMRENRLTESVIVNRGLEDGITINRPVLTAEGLIGRTFRPTAHYVRVQPLMDPGSAIGVYVEGTAYEGILRGTGQRDQMQLTDMRLYGDGDETVTPQPGQKVLTSGTGLVFPRNLLAGVISNITSEKGYIVDPVVDIRTMHSVIILTSSTLREEMLSLLENE